MAQLVPSANRCSLALVPRVDARSPFARTASHVPMSDRRSPHPHPLETESAGRTNGGRAIRQVEGGPEEHGRAPATLRRRETGDEMAAAGRDGDAAVLEQAVGRPGIPNAEYPRRRDARAARR